MTSGVAVVLANRTDGVREAVVDNTVVLWNPIDRRLHSLNPTAAAIWEAMPRVQTVGELTVLVAEQFGAQANRIRADVERVVEDLRSNGLTQGPTRARPDERPAGRIDLQPTPHTLWVRALDATIRIGIDDPALAVVIESDLAPIRHDGDRHGTQTSSIVVVTADNDMVDISVNGAAFTRVGSPLAAVARVVGEVNALAVASVPDHLVLHAGAVSRGGRSVLLPADATSGKSTLTTALMARGWSYLTDEAAAIDQSLTVRPYPKPIALDPGSFPVFPELAPITDGDDLRSALRERAWYLDPRCVGAVGGSAPAQILVSPRWTKGAATTVAPLTPLDSLHALLGHSFDFSNDDPVVFEILARLANDVAMYRLSYSDLDEAAAAIERLMG